MPVLLTNTPQAKSQNNYAMFCGDKCKKCPNPGHTSSDCRKFNDFVGDPQVEEVAEGA